MLPLPESIIEELAFQEPMHLALRFLTLAVRGNLKDKEIQEIQNIYFELGDEECLEIAKSNQVEPMVAQILCNTIPHTKRNEHWEQIRQTNANRVTSLKDSLISVVGHLESVGCRTAVVENAGVMFGSQMPFAAFCAGDFDILVDDIEWNKIEAAFAAEGFMVRSRRNRATNRREFGKTLPTGEIQWLNASSLPFDRIWIPFIYPDQTDQWLARRTRSCKTDELFVLAPEDALAWVAVHTSLHSFVRAPGIRLHADVDWLVRHNDIDWDAFVREVKVLGFPTRTFVSLSMAVGLLDTPIPVDILVALYPGEKRWKLIKGLLSKEGAFADGQQKLPYWKALILDALLDEGGIWNWARMAIAPPEDWMQQHFFQGQTNHEPLWLLRLRRLSHASHNWRPE